MGAKAVAAVFGPMIEETMGFEPIEPGRLEALGFCGVEARRVKPLCHVSPVSIKGPLSHREGGPLIESVP